MHQTPKRMRQSHSKSLFFSCKAEVESFMTLSASAAELMNVTLLTIAAPSGTGSILMSPLQVLALEGCRVEDGACCCLLTMHSIAAHHERVASTTSPFHRLWGWNVVLHIHGSDLRPP